MKLIIASNNAHKMREIQEILGNEFPDMMTLKQAGLKEVYNGGSWEKVLRLLNRL